MSALDDLIATIASGERCVQEAGGGPFVYAEKRVFSSRTARAGERLGLMALAWRRAGHRGPEAWMWVLTDAGKKRAAIAAATGDK